MKISINQKCIGCGICFSEKKYILEDVTGLAKAIEGIIVTPEDEQRITELCNLCPCQAIIKTNTTAHSNNKLLLTDMVNELENSLMKLDIPRLNHDNAQFKVEHYHFDFPDSENEIVVDYNTKASARIAAKTEFNNLVYCSSARNAQIIKILMDYKVKYAKKYYSLDDPS